MRKLWQIDNGAWVSRRKANWLANKDVFTDGQPARIATAIKEFFLSGRTENVFAPVDYSDRQECIWDWSSERAAVVQLWLLPEADEGVIAELVQQASKDADVAELLLICLSACGYEGARVGENLSTEFGRIDGVEREIFRTLLPARFDAEKWRQEVSDNFQRGRCYLSPVEAFNVMVECGFGFLTHYAANPHHPIQDFIEYWRQSMEHFHFSDLPAPMLHGRVTPKRLCDDAQKSALELCQAVRFFREPRGFDGDDTPARRFRERLLQIFEEGTGCSELDYVWQLSGTEPGRALVNSRKSGFLEAVALFGDQYRPSAMRLIHQCLLEMGGIEKAFDPALIRVCDVGLLLHETVVSLLGYQQGDAIPAYRYVCKISERFFISDPHDIELYMNIYWLVPSPSCAVNGCRPRILISYDFSTITDYSFSVLDTISIRQALFRLAEQYGLPFVRVDCLEQQAKWPAPPNMARVGVERFLFVTTGTLEDGDGFTVTESDDCSLRIVTSNIQEWVGDDDSIDLEKFRSNVMAMD